MLQEARVQAKSDDLDACNWRDVAAILNDAALLMARR